MYTKDYIQATYEVLEKNGDTDEVLNSLSVYLKKRGLLKLYPSILRGLMEKMRRTGKNSIPKVVIARESDFKKHEKEIRRLLSELGGGGHEVIIDKHLIGGFVIEGNSKRIDQSYKQELLHAYQRLTD